MLRFCHAFLLLEAGFFLVLFSDICSSQNELFQRTSDMRYASFSNAFHDRVYDQPQALLYRRTVHDTMNCPLLCLAEPKCWAVNYGLVSKKAAEFLCELFSWSVFKESHLVKKDGFIHTRIMTPCDDKPCTNGGRCQPLNEPPHYKCTGCVIFNFEHGISDWNKTGTAFDTQPTYGDNSKARDSRQSANQMGDWWIGTYENRPSPSATLGQTQGDTPTGTLTSPVFTIRGNTLSFLIGGGCIINLVYAELLIDGGSVFKETGRCIETMETRQWDVSAHTGKKARLRLVDAATWGWAHINFDHLVDEFLAENV